MSRGYRNTPRGLNGISNNIRKNMYAVNLDDYFAYGNRAQRRFAAKLLKELEKSRKEGDAN